MGCLILVVIQGEPQTLHMVLNLPYLYIYTGLGMRFLKNHKNVAQDFFYVEVERG